MRNATSKWRLFNVILKYKINSMVDHYNERRQWLGGSMRGFELAVVVLGAAALTTTPPNTLAWRQSQLVSWKIAWEYVVSNVGSAVNSRRVDFTVTVLMLFFLFFGKPVSWRKQRSVSNLMHYYVSVTPPVCYNRQRSRRS